MSAIGRDTAEYGMKRGFVMRDDEDIISDEYSDDSNHGERLSEKKSKKTLSIKLILLATISAFGYSTLGTTFATDVQLGSGRVEFGQGVLTSTACDSQVIVTPFATFANASGVAAKYKLTDIQLSDISADCYGRDFIIKAYDSATATPLNLYQTGGTTNYNSLRIYNNNGTFTLSDSGLTQAEIIAVTSGFKVTLFNSASPAAVALAEATNVFRITVESVAHDSTLVQTSSPSGSLTFNGTNSVIKYSPDSAFVLGASDFTVDVWANVNNAQSNQTFYDAGGDVNSPGSFAFWIEGGQLKIRRDGINDISFNMDNSWYDSYRHYAAVRTGGKFKIFVDGVLRAEGIDTGFSITRNAPVVGSLNNYENYKFQGELRNLRVVKGTALFTSNFTPPTTPLTKVSGTLLLLLAQDANNPFLDSSDNNFTPMNSANLPTYRAP
jgi:hypothetical protein